MYNESYKCHKVSSILCCISTSVLLAKDSEVRGKPLQLERTCHRRRTLRKTKTAGKATGNHPGRYVIHETEYAAAPFCG